ncbi:MAG: hypothetical protein IT463_04345 [Planctomycetes bacterium]|nr:hypothetical protein [Planctomycetota bacterium]
MLWQPWGQGPLGLARDASLQRGLLHLELALYPLALLPARGRQNLAANALGALATFAAASACAWLFAFLSAEPMALSSRPLALCAWLGCSGLLAAAAALGGADNRWLLRARVLLLCLLGLPALWNYFALEYAGATAGGLAALSPGLASGASPWACWPLAVLGAAGWAVAAGRAWRARP